jgi:hypothetical protein
MTRRLIGLIVIVTLAGFVAPLASQTPPPRVHRIGLLRAASAPSDQPFVESFRQGLSDLGYVEGQNLVIEQRYAGSEDRLRDLTADLVQRQVEVVVAGGSAAIRAAQHATRSAAEAQGQSEDEQQCEHEVADTGVIDVVEEVHAEGNADHSWRGKDECEPCHVGRQESSPPLAHERDHLVGEKKAQEGGFHGARTPPLRRSVQNDRRTWGADGPSEQP